MKEKMAKRNKPNFFRLNVVNGNIAQINLNISLSYISC